MVIPRQRPVEVFRVHPAVMWISIFLSVLLQTSLPLRFPRVHALDFPLLATIYFSLLRRDKIYAIALGTGLGLIEDALSHHYIGMYGMAKALVGYMAASSSFKFNLEHFAPRAILTAVFIAIHNLLFFGLQHLPEYAPRFGLFDFSSSVLSNLVVAIIIFQVLDRFKRLA